MKPLVGKSTITIAAPRAELYAWISDGRRHVELFPEEHYKDVEVLDAANGHLRFTFEMIGFSEKVELRLVERREPEFLAEEGQDAHGVEQRNEWRFEPSGEAGGSTRVTVTSTVQQELNPVVRKFAAQALGRVLRGELKNLKARATGR